MKFFYINNELCTDCGVCINSCPTEALYRSGSRKNINYDKCITCGACYRDCHAGAISIEKLEKIISRMESLDELRAKIHELENENRDLCQKMQLIADSFGHLVERLPVPIFIASRQGHITSFNSRFIELLPQDKIESGTLRSHEVTELLPDNIYNIYSQAETSGDICDELTNLGEHNVLISIYSVAQGEFNVVIFTNLSDGAILREEIVQRLKETIDRKMAMVQKIGFLLGEEMSVVVENINSVIDIIEGSDDKQ